MRRSLALLTRVTGFPLKLRDFTLQTLIFVEFCFQESDRNLRFFLHTFWRKVIEIRPLAFILAKVINFYQPLLDEGLQAIVDPPKADSQFTGNLTLACGWVVLEKLENAVSVLVGQHRLAFND